MKTDILTKLKSVQDALDNISVNGRKNVTLLTGVMNILDEIMYLISQANVVENKEDETVKAED